MSGCYWKRKTRTKDNYLKGNPPVCDARGYIGVTGGWPCRVEGPLKTFPRVYLVGASELFPRNGVNGNLNAVYSLHRVPLHDVHNVSVPTDSEERGARAKCAIISVLP